MRRQDGGDGRQEKRYRAERRQGRGQGWGQRTESRGTQGCRMRFGARRIREQDWVWGKMGMSGSK